MTHTLAIRNQNAESIFTIVATYYLLEAALEYLDDHPFAPATVIKTGMPRKNLIAIEKLLHLPRTEEHIAGAVFRNEESIAILITLNTTLDQIHMRSQAE